MRCFYGAKMAVLRRQRGVQRFSSTGLKKAPAQISSINMCICFYTNWLGVLSF